MTKVEFLAALWDRLSDLPEFDRERSLDFYSEMIDDRMEDGMTEAEAVANVGAVDDIAAQILKDSPVSQSAPVPEPESVPGSEPKREASHVRNPWGIALTSPLWILLWILAIVLVIVLWAVVVAFYAVSTALGISGALCHIAAAILAVTGQPGQGLFAWGAGVFLIGFCVLWGLGCEWLGIGVAKLCKQIFRGLRSIFVRKGEPA